MTTSPNKPRALVRRERDAWTARAWASVERRIRGMHDEDRGDVPGWVLVTLMTAGLVTALWYLAGNQLGEVFESAIDSVKGP